MLAAARSSAILRLIEQVPPAIAMSLAPRSRRSDAKTRAKVFHQVGFGRKPKRRRYLGQGALGLGFLERAALFLCDARAQDQTVGLLKPGSQTLKSRFIR